MVVGRRPQFFTRRPLQRTAYVSSWALPEGRASVLRELLVPSELSSGNCPVPSTSSFSLAGPPNAQIGTRPAAWLMRGWCVGGEWPGKRMRRTVVRVGGDACADGGGLKGGIGSQRPSRPVSWFEERSQPSARRRPWRGRRRSWTLLTPRRGECGWSCMGLGRAGSVEDPNSPVDSLVRLRHGSARPPGEKPGSTLSQAGALRV